MLVEGPGFELARVPVPSHLRPFVDSWLGYREVSSSAVLRVEYPTGRAVLIFEFGNPIALGEPNDRPLRFRTGFFAGIDERPTLTCFEGEQSGVEVNLSPAGAFALTRGALGELAGLAVESASLGIDASLCHRLREEASWEGRFRIVSDEVTRRIQGARALAPLTRRALLLLDSTNGALRIEALSRELGVSRKYLHERFVAETGFAPKRYAALRRFAYTKRMLSGGTPSLASLALRAGYADQAHMTREVRQFAGMTPSELVRRMSQPIVLEVQSLLTEVGDLSLDRV
jgi:AraC-like DNA-binding protein